MRLKLGEVAEILGTSCGTPDREAQGYSIDSRTAAAGDLFFAIRGPHFDGHQFVTQALGRGAVGAVVESAFAAQSRPDMKGSLLAVPSPTESLQRLAQFVRRKWGKQLVAITGSTGKSTTKEMIAAILAERFSVLKSQGNLNNHYGLPLTLLSLEPQHDLAVTELGMSTAGEIAFLTRLAEPQTGVVTNVAAAHLQFFDSVDAIARAKRELIENLNPSGTAVLNHDDERVRKFSEGFRGRTVSFGFSPESTFRVSEFRALTDGGSAFRVRAPSLNDEFQLQLPGRHNIQNAAAAIAASSLLEATPEDCQKALAKFRPLPLRSEIVTRPGGIVLINDSYNSNPLAMEKMLETLAHWPSAGRRIVVAGEMLELGPTSAELHRAVGRMCAECGVDWLIAVQGEARFFLVGAQQAGMASERLHFFSSAREAADFCRTLLQPGDVVLVKGSRGVHLEQVIADLQLSPSDKQAPGPAVPRN